MTLPPVAKYVAVALVALVVGGTVGRYLTPPRIETRTEVRTETAYVDRVVTKEVTVTRRAANVVRVVRVVEHPDGTRETERTVTDRTVTGTTTDTASARDTSGASTVVTVSSEVVSSRPNVRLGLLIGLEAYGTRGLFGATGAAAPLGPALVGAQIEGRVAGPLVAGGWVLTNGHDVLAGGSLGWEF